MGLYWAVYWGLPIGTAALIGGLQPVITAVFAMVLLGERLAASQWAGVALGFFGLAAAVCPKMEASGTGITLLASAIAGVASMAYASVYQKRFAEAGNTWTRTALMFVGATRSVTHSGLGERGPVAMKQSVSRTASTLSVAVVAVYLGLRHARRTSGTAPVDP